MYLSANVCCCVISDGISVTGLPVSSPLRQVLKPRSENKSVGADASKNEYNHVKVSFLFPSYTTSALNTPVGLYVFFVVELHLIQFFTFSNVNILTDHWVIFCIALYSNCLILSFCGILMYSQVSSDNCVLILFIVL